MRDNGTTIIATVFGTLFSIVGVDAHGLASTFVLGAVGAVGGYLGTLVIKWIIRKIVDSIKL
jgi:hypothetical protein